jgi:hypothetical protein
MITVSCADLESDQLETRDEDGHARRCLSIGRRCIGEGTFVTVEVGDGLRRRS